MAEGPNPAGTPIGLGGLKDDGNNTAVPTPIIKSTPNSIDGDPVNSGSGSTGGPGGVNAR